jgi:CRP/FNR family transcriptional regulator
MAGLDLDPIAELQLVPALSELAPEAITDMAAVATSRRLRAHEVIVEQGHVAAGLVVLVRGAVKSVRTVSAHKQKVSRVLDVARAPGVVTDSSAFDGLPADASIIALRSCQALMVDRRALARLMTTHPSLDRALFRLLVKEHRGQVRRTDELAVGSVEERVHRLLEGLAREHGTVLGQGRFIPLPLRRKDLASMVNATTETVSRMIAKLEREGKVQSSRDGLWWRGGHKRAHPVDSEQ